MRPLSFAILAATCFASPSFADWNEGGTLHRASFAEWNESSQANRLATSGDWAIQLIGVDQVEKISADDFKLHSARIASCITQVGVRTDKDMVASHAAVGCAVNLNW